MQKLATFSFSQTLAACFCKWRVWPWRAQPARMVALLGASLLGACAMPPLPDTKPTVQQVPFLGQQLTKEQIDTWRTDVDARRARLQADYSQQKVACYQRFLVNRCLKQNQREYAAQEHVLHFQDVELNRQERVLTEVDRQLRIQQKAQQLQ